MGPTRPYLRTFPRSPRPAATHQPHWHLCWLVNSREQMNSHSRLHAAAATAASEELELLVPRAAADMEQHCGAAGRAGDREDALRARRHRRAAGHGVRARGSVRRGVNPTRRVLPWRAIARSLARSCLSVKGVLVCGGEGEDSMLGATPCWGSGPAHVRVSGPLSGLRALLVNTTSTRGSEENNH
jgi:hypothetical protein